MIAGQNEVRLQQQSPPTSESATAPHRRRREGEHGQQLNTSFAREKPAAQHLVARLSFSSFPFSFLHQAFGCSGGRTQTTSIWLSTRTNQETLSGYQVRRHSYLGKVGPATPPGNPSQKRQTRGRAAVDGEKKNGYTSRTGTRKPGVTRKDVEASERR